ncbi:sulfite exporter TauE/SafE family protein [Oceanomicrobium pacificus]|uniref:sulfite exporter TauE/SafE family protein n=1 Tax=Oceanomicrobium pacificus TaxID=2692916 RepID=UPI002E2A4084|nr:sulfite exporter TauE/SafE family protein [Oceanomicrobium pacificus]
MELDATFFAFAIPAVLFAGMSKGGFGGGAAFAASPLLALILPPQYAIGVMLPLLMVMDVTAIRAYWRLWDWRNARALMAGAVPGILLGSAIYSIADPDLFRLLIGLIAVGFVCFQIARGRGWISVAPRPFSAIRAGSWGGVAGLTSFISHAGGPPAAVHLLGQNLGKTTYQATTVLTFWWINLVKVPPYAMLGMFSRESLTASLMLAPVAILGVLVGVVAHRVVPERLFFQITYTFLLITGSKLIFDALT